MSNVNISPSTRVSTPKIANKSELLPPPTGPSRQSRSPFFFFYSQLDIYIILELE